MMKTRFTLPLLCSVFALALALPTTGRAQRSRKRLPRTILVPGSGGLHIPFGGMARGAAPGGRGKIVIYSYRGSAPLLDRRLRRTLRRFGWKIVSQTRSPRGAIRLRAARAGLLVRLSIVAARRGGATLIITKPARVAKPKPLPMRGIRVPGFYGLHIPVGGLARGAAPGGRGRIVTYTYRRSVLAVTGGLFRLLKRHGWTVVSRRKSPRGALRLRVRRGKRSLRISVVRNRSGAALILMR